MEKYIRPHLITLYDLWGARVTRKIKESRRMWLDRNTRWIAEFVPDGEPISGFVLTESNVHIRLWIPTADIAALPQRMALFAPLRDELTPKIGENNLYGLSKQRFEILRKVFPNAVIINGHVDTGHVVHASDNEALAKETHKICGSPLAWRMRGIPADVRTKYYSNFANPVMMIALCSECKGQNGRPLVVRKFPTESDPLKAKIHRLGVRGMRV